MSWTLSQFRAGDWVEVRSREEILGTLDENGCLEGLPFMPEMLACCGQRFTVSAVAHKSCDTVKRTWISRRMNSTVHLTGSRCDGSAHGGCEADCNLFWKDAWLKPMTEGATPSQPSNAAPPTAGCTLDVLHAKTQLPIMEGETSPRYSCQATEHYHASAPLAWWNPQQYIRDVCTGNHGALHVVRVIFFAMLSQVMRSTPFGYRIIKSIRRTFNRWFTGRSSPDIDGKIPEGHATPTGRLNLKAGELVRVRTLEEIEKTIKQDRTNRGLTFDQEMIPFCGRVLRVKRVVTQIIDEPTGKMIPMKNPCIVLEGGVCGAEYSRCRLMCPRAIPSFWREVWLERVEPAVEPAKDSEANVEVMAGIAS